IDGSSRGPGALRAWISTPNARRQEMRGGRLDADFLDRIDDERQVHGERALAAVAEPADARGVLLRATAADLGFEGRGVLVHPAAAYPAQHVDQAWELLVERAEPARLQPARAVVPAVEADRAHAAA